MGGLFSKVWSSKRSFRDHLEHLESEIKRLEDRQHRNAIIKRQVGGVRACFTCSEFLK